VLPSVSLLPRMMKPLVSGDEVFCFRGNLEEEWGVTPLVWGSVPLWGQRPRCVSIQKFNDVREYSLQPLTSAF
jgi:hypothetical protein